MLLEAAQLLRRGAAAKSTPAWEGDALKPCQAPVQHLSCPTADPTADAGCDPPPHPPNRNFRAKPAAGGISHLLPASAWLCPGALGNLLLTQASPVFLHPVQVPAGSFSCFYVIHFREIKDPNLGIPCSYTSTAPSQAKVLQPHRAFCPSASLRQAVSRVARLQRSPHMPNVPPALLALNRPAETGW